MSTLAAYLRASDGQLDVRLTDKLADMIDGPSSSTGWRLVVKKHPELASNATGRERKLANERRERKIARYMADHGALEASCFESAVMKTCAKFAKSRRTVIAIWSRRKAFAKRAHQAINSLREDPPSGQF